MKAIYKLKFGPDLENTILDDMDRIKRIGADPQEFRDRIYLVYSPGEYHCSISVSILNLGYFRPREAEKLIEVPPTLFSEGLFTKSELIEEIDKAQKVLANHVKFNSEKKLEELRDKLYNP